MSYRQSYQSYTPPHRAQDRASYGQAQGPRSPPPRPSVGGEAQHARYSSADLYALHHAPPATATYSDARPSLEAGYGHSARGSSNSEIPGAQRYPSSPGAYDSDEDDDDSPGFASHGDLASVAQRRSQQYPQPQPQQRPYSYQPPVEQSHRMRPMAPPLLSQTSRMTTKSAFDFTVAEPASASTTKLADELIDAPILSKNDWSHGEAIKAKHEHDAEKQRRKRDRVKGEVLDISFGIGDFVKRNWKWIVPLLAFLSVAAILCCYFLIPRTPTITFDSPKVPSPALFATAASNDSSSAPYVSSADPTSFRFDASLALAIDASASYLAVNYHSFDLTLRLQETGGVVARQSYGSGDISVPARRVTSYEFPITFFGNYTNSADPTYQAVRSACAHKYATIYRPPLNLTVSVESTIIGVINPPTRIARLDAVDCPVEWSKTAS